MNFFTQLNQKLDEGWKLTDANCPICKASIIFNPKDKSLYCLKCDKPCKMERETIDNNDEEEQKQVNKKDAKNEEIDSDSDYDQDEFKWQMNKNAPPSRTDEISKLLAQKLLQGYAMLEESCYLCLAPIMRSKNNEYTCVGCKWVKTKKQFDEIVQAQMNNAQQQPQQQQLEQPKQQQQQQEQPRVQQQQQVVQQNQAAVKKETQVVQSTVETKPQIQNLQPIQDSGERQQFYSTMQRILNKTANFYEKQIDLYTQQGQVAIVDNIIKTSLKDLIVAQKQLEQQ